jgi:hypothetical protein
VLWSAEPPEDRCGLLVDHAERHVETYRQKPSLERKARAETMVIAGSPTITISAARHSSFRVGSRATCSVMTSRPHSTLAMSVRS